MPDRYRNLFPKNVPEVYTAPVAAVTVPAKKRFHGHCLEMLRLLRVGRVSLETLRSISANHTARISNLRKAGYGIECHQDRSTGQSWYELTKDIDEN